MPVNTIFVVMMENRSFDHLLGHLSLSGHPVEGLRDDPAWRHRVANGLNGRTYEPFRLPDPYRKMDADLPHNRDAVSTQLGDRTGDSYKMDGFVESYAAATQADPGDNPPPMGYFTADEAPVTDFLAREFAVCDHWHAALPAGTQPNRLMAMSGTMTSDGNHVPMPYQELVYEWLNLRGISWRVYHQNLPFFALMLERLPDILDGGNFRPFPELWEDVDNEPPGVFPQVVFLEPAYSDAPHLGGSTDDHAPAGIKGGQGFLLQAYRAVSKVRDIWQNSAMIVTYDEHGGFFDHVSPPLIPTDPPPGSGIDPFHSLGVRVPALVVSPFVTPGHVHHGVMDHLSILKFIAETFGDGHYSPEVDARPVDSVSAVLNNPEGVRSWPVVPSLNDYLAREQKPAGRLPGTRPQTEIQDNFQQALDRIGEHPNPPAFYADLLTAFPRQPL